MEQQRRVTTSSKDLSTPIVRPDGSQDFLKCEPCGSIFHTLTTFINHKSTGCQSQRFSSSVTAKVAYSSSGKKPPAVNTAEKKPAFVNISVRNTPGTNRDERKTLDGSFSKSAGRQIQIPKLTPKMTALQQEKMNFKVASTVKDIKSPEMSVKDAKQACGECEGCLREEDCGECATCLVSYNKAFLVEYFKFSGQSLFLINRVYKVEKVLGKRYHQGVLEYLLKWKGYPSSENCWEPEVNILSKNLIEEFEWRKRRERSYSPETGRGKIKYPITKLKEKYKSHRRQVNTINIQRRSPDESVSEVRKKQMREKTEPVIKLIELEVEVSQLL
ncbi:uncharacterized protein LOC143233219 [Tachypleus tridentatus]|uniref:uncharacterized protein LOC143233219 n=1 Tax=Tachypleus tridentatus TaxID=6853 RepID=UPI003FD01714